MDVFHSVILKDVELTGRLYELGLIGGYVLASMQVMDGIDMAVNLGLPMFAKGKIDLLPERIKDRAEMAEIFKRTEEMGKKG